ncbi:hypothetical protein BHE74_00056828, partial [Ensete ventricosum]
LAASDRPLRLGHNRSCPRAATPCRGSDRSRSPICREALAAVDRPLAGGQAKPYCPSTSLPSLRKRNKNV